MSSDARATPDAGGIPYRRLLGALLASAVIGTPGPTDRRRLRPPGGPLPSGGTARGFVRSAHAAWRASFAFFVGGVISRWNFPVPSGIGRGIVGERHCLRQAHSSLAWTLASEVMC